MDVEWFTIRSQHGVKTFTNFTSRANIDFIVAKAYCGRKIEFRADEESPLSATFDKKKKTCESCLRNMSLEGRV